MCKKHKPFVAAIIPARGGSSLVPRKNLRSLAGEPLMWHTLKAAQGASSLDFIVVSTEDDKIAKYIASLGVQLLRHPPELSTDTSPTFPVIRWALNALRKIDINPDICVVLRATSPLRLSYDIDCAVQLLIENEDADSVVSVVPAIGVHPIRLKRMREDRTLVDAFEFEGHFPKRRQEFELLYLRNGAVYAARAAVIDNIGLWGDRCLAYVMPEERSININTDFQFRLSELVILNS